MKKGQRMSIKELAFSLIDKVNAEPVLLKRVTAHESQVIDTYRKTVKYEEINLFKELMEDQDVYNVVQNGNEILIYK